MRSSSFVTVFALTPATGAFWLKCGQGRLTTLRGVCQGREEVGLDDDELKWRLKMRQVRCCIVQNSREGAIGESTPINARYGPQHRFGPAWLVLSCSVREVGGICFLKRWGSAANRRYARSVRGVL
uniref:Uncharacterized protein n=1 Tax=Salmonella sp. TaxID=599 RepID=A0A482ETA9_SALSP|nr:hypothetical protein NNIBIDOC_00093 [Salmonella sp.]